MSDATAQAAEAAPETYTLKIERVFKAPRSLVYEAFTEPHRLQAWWGPTGCQSTVHELDVRVGGAYRIEMHMPAGTKHLLSGVFHVVEPPARLVYSWIWGQGDLEGLEMTVTLEFVDHPDGTELRLTQEGLPSEDSRRLHNEGWSSGLDRLEALF